MMSFGFGESTHAVGKSQRTREVGKLKDALEPSNAAAANGLGLLHIESGRTSDAAAAFEQAVKLDPSNATFWTNLRKPESSTRTE